MPRKLLALALVLAILAAAVPALAQSGSTRSVTVTEAEINATYRVTNPPRQSISEVYVDLQPDQVVIGATFTPRRGSAAATVTTLVPSLENGRVYWTVTSITANGQPAAADLVAQVNATITASWQRYIREQAGTGRITGFVITDTDATLTYETGAPASGEAPIPPPLSGTVTLTEAEVNAAYVVTNPPRQSISEVYVDLQPDQVVIGATFTPRRGSAAATTTTLVPSLEDGRVYWSVTSITANGQPASTDLVAQVNASITASWQRYFRQAAGTGRISSFVITDSEATATLEARS